MKKKILNTVGLILKKLTLLFNPTLIKDAREVSSFKLIFFAGNKGVEMLNACLVSVYKNWKTIPEIIILSDGSFNDKTKKKLIKWPCDINIIDWKVCADYYSNKGNGYLQKYAYNEIWGKKMVSILYCFEHWDCLYNDTDVLWYNDPTTAINDKRNPYIKMSQGTVFAFSQKQLDYLEEFQLFKPENFMCAGIIFGRGDFSIYKKWNSLCEFLEKYADNRTEQTTFAILTNCYGDIWNLNEIFAATDDMYNVYNKYNDIYKKILARHYVTTKIWIMWRDYYRYILLKRNNVLAK